LDTYFSGYWWSDNEKETEYLYEITNFNILEGDCDFRVTWRSSSPETCTFKLYPVEMWSYFKRDYLPGRTDAPKLFLGTLRIPENTFDGLSEKFKQALTEKYAKKDRALFQYTIAASEHFLFMRDNAGTNEILFLTDHTLENSLPNFHHTHLVTSSEELRRYSSPELAFNPDKGAAGNDTGELTAQIEANRAFRDELQYRIRLLKWSQVTGFKISFLYIPAHYIAILTPLRFIDVPKIHTATSFGDRLVLTNKTYNDLISNIRIWEYEKIIELLEVRIKCYEDTAKTLKNDTETAILPEWYSETITGYWNIAGLPHTTSGTFFSPSLSPVEQIPSVLAFTDNETGREYFGWQFAADEFAGGEATSFLFFIDPRKSARTIYSRKGKTPAQGTIRLDCTLYINPGANTAQDQNIIEHCLKPFIRPDSEGINVRISFNGNTFEIREYPATHSNPLIFRGQMIP
jgi:hypothetical protein